REGGPGRAHDLLDVPGYAHPRQGPHAGPQGEGTGRRGAETDRDRVQGDRAGEAPPQGPHRGHRAPRRESEGAPTAPWNEGGRVLRLPPPPPRGRDAERERGGASLLRGPPRGDRRDPGRLPGPGDVLRVPDS